MDHPTVPHLRGVLHLATVPVAVIGGLVLLLATDTTAGPLGRRHLRR